MGYANAGFKVYGVDIKDQPNYPFTLTIDDALNLTEGVYKHFDLIHASPPCQAHSDLQKQSKRDYTDLIGPVREMLIATGKPYIIENVDGAPLHTPITLCGTMFPGLRVIRHRLFESNLPLVSPEIHPKHPLVFTYDKRKKHYGKLNQNVHFVQVTGGGNCTWENALDAMGIPWYMTKKEVNEAIPPAYTKFLGEQVLEYLHENL